MDLTPESICDELGKIAGNSEDLVSTSISLLDVLKRIEDKKERCTKLERDLVESLLSCWIRIQNLVDDALYAYIERNVWTCRYKTIFFLRFPLDWVLVKMIGKSVTKSGTRFVIRAVDEGANSSKLAASLVQYFTRQLRYPCSTKLCDCVIRVLITLFDGENAILFEDDDLFASLAEGVRTEPSSASSAAVFCIKVCDFFVDTSLMRPLVKVLTYHAFKGDSDRTSLDIFGLFSVLSFKEEWEGYMARVITTRFVPLNYAPKSATLLVNSLLSTTSYRLVVELERKGSLSQLRNHAYLQKDDDVWRRVLLNLENAWPSSPPLPRTSSSTCPITLDSPSDPVVASDGVTYDKTAILQHMSKNGMTSPVSRGKLSYHLYRNLNA